MGKTTSDNLAEIMESPSLSLEYIEKFENAMTESQGAKWGIGVSNCTAGIFASLLAVGLDKGDEVIVPPLSWPQTYFPARFLGANIKTVDLHPDWPVMSPELVEKKITSMTRVVISVGLWGYSSGIKEIQGICKRRNVIHILDAAQLIEANRQQGGIGHLADFVVLSFGNTKKMANYGEGGMVLGLSDEMRNRVLFLSQHPFRIHKDVQDERLLEQNFGFNFNFRLHPMTAYYGLKRIMSEENTADQMERVQKLLKDFKILVLNPPQNWITSDSNGAAILINVNGISPSKIERLKNELVKIGLWIKRCPYMTIRELFRTNKAVLPWYKNRTRRRSTLSPIPFAESWQENLRIISR